jgi:hypothetical protein
MARQKMLTKEILDKVPALYAQDGLGDDAIAYAKFFNPCGAGTWYMTEYNPEDGTAFGKVILQDEELGYFSIPELESVRVWGGLFIERDIYFTPKPLKDCD